MFNVFGLGPSQAWFGSFEQFSTTIVTKTAECDGLIPDYNGPIFFYGQKKYEKGCDKADVDPYHAQFGLQSRIVSSLFGSDLSSKDIKVLNILLGIMMAAVLMLFVAWVSREHGIVSARTVYIFTLFSPWLAAFSTNLYWVVFLHFLPFIAGLWLYPYFRNIGKTWIYFSISGILMFIKFLNGYEYASTIAISALLPVIYYQFIETRRPSFRQLLLSSVLMFLTSVVAFAGAATMNVASLVRYAGSWSSAVEYLEVRASSRSDASNYRDAVIRSMKRSSPYIYEAIDRVYDLDQLADGKGTPLKYAFISVLTYATLPAVTIPISVNQPLSTLLQSISVIAILSFLSLRSIRKAKPNDRRVVALAVLYWGGLVGALSWLVLMSGHAYVHPHINAIVFHMPFLLICYVLIGIWFDSSKLKRGMKRVFK